VPRGLCRHPSPNWLPVKDPVIGEIVPIYTLNIILSCAIYAPMYSISKIISATSQVVAGSKHIYSVELINADGDTKLCTVEIWSRSWVENGVEVTFRCANEPELVRSHSA